MNEEKNPTITAYITEFALTKGIEKVTAVRLLHIEPKHSSIIRVNNYYSSEKFQGIPINCTKYFAGDNWHTTPEAALAQANKMRDDKIKKLKDDIKEIQDKIDKLESLNVSIEKHNE